MIIIDPHSLSALFLSFFRQNYYFSLLKQWCSYAHRIKFELRENCDLDVERRNENELNSFEMQFSTMKQLQSQFSVKLIDIFSNITNKCFF